MAIRLKDIIASLPPTEVVGDSNKEIDNVVSVTAQGITARDILWVSDKNIDLLGSIREGVVICSADVKREYFNVTCTYILVPNPRLYFLNCVKYFFWEQEPPFISKESIIDTTVKIGRDVTVRAGVVIEKNCVIGDETIIDSNTVVKKGTLIGQRVKIGANNTIGGEGFGYEKNEDGQFEFIPHIGNVIIEDDVEIGNNTTIDRGVLGSTIIRKNAKIDNLVHIAHGVEIGENSLVIANAMVAGSVSIGKNVWVAPSASILNKLKVGDSATIGMGAVVIKDVQSQQTVVGNPAKDLAQLKKVTN